MTDLTKFVDGDDEGSRATNGHWVSRYEDVPPKKRGKYGLEKLQVGEVMAIRVPAGAQAWKFNASVRSAAWRLGVKRNIKFTIRTEGDGTVMVYRVK